MAQESDRSKLPLPDPSFAGSAGRTIGDSVPDWDIIGDAGPPAGAPNILLVLIDDAGFGQPSTFGGPIATPNCTRMAQGGLRSEERRGGEAARPQSRTA